jgi:hypothetical protein
MLYAMLDVLWLVLENLLLSHQLAVLTRPT